MAIALYGLMLISVIGFVGMAVDIGTIYMIRARLSAAVDAAALAAGRSVNLQNNLQEAQTAAQNTATQFFNANFPSGYFNSIGSPTVTPTLTQETDANGNPSGVLDFQVTATVAAPTYFMNIFNVHSINVATTGTASRRGVVMVLVLDISSSMNTPTTPTACQAMAAAASNFVTLFSPFDYVGVLPFDLTVHTTNAKTGYPPAQNQLATLSTAIAAIAPPPPSTTNQCGSNTNTITALNQAYQWIKSVGEPLALNTIVLFTDGSPNGITANFQTRTQLDSRWGFALNEPDGNGFQGTLWTNATAPTGTSTPPGIANSCDPQGSNNAICINMPTVCTNAADTIFGSISQTSGQNSYGGQTYGMQAPLDGVSISIPASCQATSPKKGSPGTLLTGLPSADYMRQYVAYIPDTDYYGNNLHGVTATGSGPTVANGLVTRDNWLFQVNNECSPDPTVTPNCKNVGDLWSNYTNIGMVSNFFPLNNNAYANADVYAGKFRPDQPNSIVAASMNGTMDQANTVRKDTTYNIKINVIYLTGNGGDAVDREFLPIVANAKWIIPLPYDSQYVADATNPTQLYQNPAYQTTQQTGTYLVTADKTQLTSLFAQLASETLRLSH